MSEQAQTVVLQVKTEFIPQGDDNRLLWSAHLTNYIRDVVDHAPNGAEILSRKESWEVPDTRLHKAIPVDDLKELIDGLRQAANPRVEWQDDQIDMARDAIKIMRMEITTLLNSFIERNDIQAALDREKI